MITTSDKYKQVLKDSVRSFNCLVEITVDDYYTTLNPTSNINIDTTNEAEITNEKTLHDRIPAFYNYASLENNYTQLDGTYVLPNKNFDNKYTGFISNSNTGSLIIKPLTGDATISGYRKFNIIFEKGYPIDYEIICKCSNSSNNDYYVSFSSTNNSDDTLMLEIPEIYEYNGTNYTYYSTKEITITINEWSNNYNFRIGRVIYGSEVLIYDTEEIVSMNMLEQTDFTNTNVPSNSYNIKLDNYKRKFNIIQENNILNKLSGQTIIRTYIGLNIDGVPEYVYMGEYAYSSYKENDDKTLELSCDGQLNKFENIDQFMYLNGSSSSTYDYAVLEILQNSNLPEISFTGNIYLGYSNFSTRKEQAQALAIYYSANIKQYRDYRLHSSHPTNVENMATDLNLFNIDDTIKTIIRLTDQIRNPIFTKFTKTKKIIATHIELKDLSSSKSEIYNDVVSFTTGSGGRLELTLSSPIDGGTVDVYIDNTKVMENGSIISGSGYYTVKNNSYYSMLIRMYPDSSFNGNKTVKVMAKQYNTEDVTETFENNNISQGAITEYRNNFFRNSSYKSRVAYFIFNNEQDYRFETEILSDPSLEVGDTILLESVDGLHKCTIDKIDTNYNGGLTSRIEGVSTNVI